MTRQPALFIGHGSPMNAIEDTEFARGWERLGKALPKPKAIVVVSAHWYVPGTRVTAQSQPKTIHDFGPRFPKELFEKQYPAPGNPELAKKVQALLGEPAETTEKWGLDHGAWAVLVHLYPNADIPVIQVSIDKTLTNEQHYELGKKLASLRDDGILVLASGSLVHNLDASRDPAIDQSKPSQNTVDFNDFVKRGLADRSITSPLVQWEKQSTALEAHPTPEHYLPILYLLGLASETTDEISIPLEGFDTSSLSMMCVQVG